MYIINEPIKGIYCVIDTKAAKMVPNTLTRHFTLARIWKRQLQAGTFAA